MANAFLSYIVKQGRPDFWYGDGGPEYQGEFEDLLHTLQVAISRSAPETHEQNPAEYIMRVVGQGTRCSLLHSGAPLVAWADAMLDCIDHHLSHSHGSGMPA